MTQRIKTYLLLIVFTFIWNVSFTQSSFVVSGVVYDSISNSPIKNVHIKIIGTSNGTVSDSRGSFFIKVNKVPVKLKISHISFENKTIELKTIPQKKVYIPIVYSENKINQINISAKNKVVELTRKKFYDVSDFEIIGDSIYLLAYNWQKKINPWLILMNKTGDTLINTHIPSDGNLYKDCLNNLHIIGENTAFQISVNENKFELNYPIKSNKFQEIMSACVEELNNKLYIKQYSYSQQILSYFCADIEDTTAVKFRIIADQAALRRVSDQGRFFSMGVTPTAADIRFEEMCFYDPIYAPLLKVKDSICILNFVESKIEYYNQEMEIISAIDINFHKQRHWKENVFVDDVTGNIYVLFEKNGISSLRKLNKTNGKLGKIIDIPSFKWVKKIIINDNTIYFLYKKHSNLELMRLFKYNII